MARYTNPYYSTPGLGQAFMGLSQVINGDPAAVADAQYQASRQALTEQELADLRAKATARHNVQNRLRTLDPSTLPQMVPSLYGEAYGAGDYNDLGSALLSMMSNMQAPDAQVARSFVGAGHAIGPTDAFSLPGQDLIRRDTERQNVNELATKEAGLGARNAADIQGQNYRYFNGPISASPGERITFSAADPRGAGGPVLGLPTETTVLGTTLQDMANGTPLTPGQQGVIDRTHPEARPSPASVMGQIYTDMASGKTLTPGQERVISTENPPKEPPQLLDVTPSESGSLAKQVYASLNIPMYSDGTLIAEGMGPDVTTKLAQIVARAGQIYQLNRNATLAVQQAIQESGITGYAPGKTRWFDPNDPGQLTTVPAQSPETAAPAPSAAPTSGGPKPGDVIDGYQFKGGDPNDPNNWTPAT